MWYVVTCGILRAVCNGHGSNIIVNLGLAATDIKGQITVHPKASQHIHLSKNVRLKGS
jgi:hypothetical protein